MKFHKVKKWLLRGYEKGIGTKEAILDGCEREDANTIREAVQCFSDYQLSRIMRRVRKGADVEHIPERRLIRRLARELSYRG
jgi:hypothetical protein